MTFTHALSTNNYGPAKFIVSASAANGTHTTIGAALTSASSGDTIFIRPGTYTENPTLKAGVNLVAYNGDQITPNVTIVGKCTMTTAGTVVISGIRLQTNSDFFLAVTGSAASVVTLMGCFLNASNNTGISFTAANTSASINVNYCFGNIATTSIAMFASSSTGQINFAFSSMTNGGGTSTANTISAGSSSSFQSTFMNPITSSGTAAVSLEFCDINTSAQNSICFTNGGSGGGVAQFCSFASGSAACISTSQAISLIDNIYNSTNTNPVTGAGTLTFFSGSQFTSTGKGINVTTQTAVGAISGIQSSSTALPTAGFIGEQIRATLASGSAASLTTNTALSLANISLTSGVWDVSAVVEIGSNTTTSFTQYIAAISANNNSLTGTVLGDSQIASNSTSGIVGNGITLTIPAFRVTLTATTTYYLIAQATFTVSSAAAFGRISATRVG